MMRLLRLMFGNGRMAKVHPIPSDSLDSPACAAARGTPARTTVTSSRSDQSQAGEAHAGLRLSARGYGWTALGLALPLLLVLRILGIALLVAAIPAFIWPNEQEARAWFTEDPTS
ncbi:hypothetical protein [Streptomyces sp. NPDC058157]|uniref:hypothetical protein n=1 Tax=Streptomyces sp. NPDC058157 TaxID=3346360 RepID=UPI0036EEC5DB